MDKKEQIQALLEEWKEEDSEKRSFALIMTQVEGEHKENSDIAVSQRIMGCKTCLIDAFEHMLFDKRNILHEILHKANCRYMDKLASDINKRLTKKLKDILDKDNQTIN